MKRLAEAALLAATILIGTDCAAQEVAYPDILEQWRQDNKDRWEANMESLTVKDGDLSMKFSYQIFGDKPSDGRSMYISMHGGGNTAASVNDSQWENQKRLYKPDEGVYVCPRAPWNDWDMWFKPPMDRLLEELIQTLAYTLDVNPDKVYLMGYSAGGDGVWRLAPRLADHFASASMMAGHPGNVSLVNVRTCHLRYGWAVMTRPTTVTVKWRRAAENWIRFNPPMKTDIFMRLTCLKATRTG